MHKGRREHASFQSDPICLTVQVQTVPERIEVLEAGGEQILSHQVLVRSQHLSSL